MWIRELLAGFVGLSAGFAVAGGLFALLMALGIVSRFAGRTHTGAYIRWYENAACLGGILGNLFSLLRPSIPAGLPGAAIFGLFSGIYTGAWAMALTEIMEVIPIFSRRIRLRKGLPWIILAMALGRTAGALLHAYYGFG